ncbi:MAG TPA: glycosyltransferase, partial [Terriglobales bacterium]|nr:glycosyltransferase [Terriglobales bacterium]
MNSPKHFQAQPADPLMTDPRGADPGDAVSEGTGGFLMDAADLRRPKTEARTIRVLSLMEATFVTGPARALLDFAAMAGRGLPGVPRVESAVATFERGRANSANVFVERATQAGLHVDVIREGFPFDPAILPQLRRLVAERQPDIIQSMNFKSHFLVRLLGLHQRRRWVAFHHGYTWTDLKNRAYNQLDRWSLPAADHVVTVCRPFASELVNIGVNRQRISVQHNAAPS